MKKGFTLVELLAVVAIIAIISLVAGVSYNAINKDHQKKACKAFEEQLKNAAIEYYQDRSYEFKDGNSKIIYLWDIINDPNFHDGKRSKVLIDYTIEEVENITGKKYGDIQNYYVSVYIQNNNYKATLNNNLCD